MRTLAILLILSASAHAANEVVSPGPPPNPNDYINFTLAFTPQPAKIEAQQVGGLFGRTTIVGNTAWLPKFYVSGSTLFRDGEINFFLDGRPWWSVDFNPEIAAGLTAATLTLTPVAGGGEPDRTATITAPGYSRTFPTELAPEPSASILAIMAVMAIRARYSPSALSMSRNVAQVPIQSLALSGSRPTRWTRWTRNRGA